MVFESPDRPTTLPLIGASLWLAHHSCPAATFYDISLRLFSAHAARPIQQLE
jgi:hypothetical protein